MQCQARLEACCTHPTVIAPSGRPDKQKHLERLLKSHGSDSGQRSLSNHSQNKQRHRHEQQACDLGRSRTYHLEKAWSLLGLRTSSRLWPGSCATHPAAHTAIQQLTCACLDDGFVRLPRNPLAAPASTVSASLSSHATAGEKLAHIALCLAAPPTDKAGRQIGE